jgi:hypothetical protein
VTAGDRGIVFKFFPTVVSPYNPRSNIPFPIDPTATVKMLVQITSTPVLPHEEYLMTVAADGLSAYYVFTGTEFPAAGLYRITMRLETVGTRLTAENPVLFKVDPDFIN